jgi:hypothetical protein
MDLLVPVIEFDGTADRDHRVAFRVRRGKPGGQVRAARTGRHECYAGLAGEAADGGCHEGGIGLVPDDNRFDTRIFEGVKDPVDFRAWNAKNVLDALRY